MSEIENRKVIFVGSKQIGLMALQTLVDLIPLNIGRVITFDDSRDSRSVLPKFKDYCQATKLPLSIINKPSELAELVRFDSPYIVFVVGWYWIISSDVMKTVPGGFVGVHASLLPQYRGNAPLVWAILRGEKQTGVSLFYFDDGIDTGDIVGQIAFSIDKHETIADLLSKAETATFEVLSKFALPLVMGIAPRKKQLHEKATYVSLRRPEDGRIDWNLRAERLYDFIRAQTRPYPGAYTTLPDGKILRIWRASVFPYPFYGIPGLVGQRFDDGIVVSCGEGALVIREYTVDSDPGMPPEKILKWACRLC